MVFFLVVQRQDDAWVKERLSETASEYLPVTSSCVSLGDDNTNTQESRHHKRIVRNTSYLMLSLLRDVSLDL